jgi:hypothetical protein
MDNQPAVLAIADAVRLVGHTHTSEGDGEANCRGSLLAFDGRERNPSDQSWRWKSDRLGLRVA